MELKPGYKQTEVGVIPEDWSCTFVRDAASPKQNAIVGGPFGSDLVSADYTNDGIPVIRGQNMSAGFVAGDFVFVSNQKAKSLSANLAYSCDLVFTQRGTLGQISVVPEGEYPCYLISQSQMKLALNTKRHDPLFVYQYFASSSGQKQIIGSAIQTGVPHTNLGILKSYQFPAPPLDEQSAIATALSDVDALLTAQDAQIAKKRAIKQGAMQELLTGKRRVPGFSGEWEVKRLEDVLAIRHGRDQKAVIAPDGQFPILATGGQIGWTNQWLYNKPSVLIGRKGTIDRPQYAETPFWTVDTLFYSELKGGNTAKFFYYRFCLIEWQRYNEASGVPSLNAKTIENIELACPLPDEQAAIAKVLSDIDSAIATLETKRFKTAQLKQGMMQALLTGRIRLV